MSILPGIYASQITGHLSTNSYESIATTIVGAGGQASVTFSSIPSTYKHLQIRCLAQEARATYWLGDMNLKLNGATSGYSYHYVNGNGSVTDAYGAGSQSNMPLGSGAIGTSTGGTYAAVIIDILDYADTNKYKTVRALMGFDTNGTGGGNNQGGRVTLTSGSYQSTSAVTSLTLTGGNANLTQYSSFALYGIKG